MKRAGLVPRPWYSIAAGGVTGDLTGQLFFFHLLVSSQAMAALWSGLAVCPWVCKFILKSFLLAPSVGWHTKGY
jgi:hypothetical protein